MSTQATPDSATRPSVGLPVIIVSVLVVIGFIAFLGYQLLTPKVYLPPLSKSAATPDPSQVAFQTWAKQKYAETGGDWSKLAKADQDRLNSAARGKGKSMFETFKP